MVDVKARYTAVLEIEAVFVATRICPHVRFSPQMRPPLPLASVGFFSLTASRHTSSQGRLVAIGQTGPCFRSSGFDGEKLIAQQSRNNQRQTALENTHHVAIAIAIHNRSARAGSSIRVCCHCQPLCLLYLNLKTAIEACRNMNGFLTLTH